MGEQAVVCAADDTIQLSHSKVHPDGQTSGVVNGVGAVHQCGDSGFIQKKILRSQSDPIAVDRKLRAGDTLGSILEERVF